MNEPTFTLRRIEAEHLVAAVEQAAAVLDTLREHASADRILRGTPPELQAAVVAMLAGAVADLRAGILPVEARIRLPAPRPRLPGVGPQEVAS